MVYGQSDCGPKNHPEPSNITEPSSHNLSAISHQGEFLMGIEPLTQTYSTTILQKMVRSPQEDVWSVTGPEDPRAWRKAIDSPLL